MGGGTKLTYQPAASHVVKYLKPVAFQISLAFVVLGFAGISVISRAQQTQTSLRPKSKPAESQATDQQQLLYATAINTLLSVADSAKKWDDRIAVVRVEAQVADLLWEADPDAARSYLVKAWETTDQIAEPKQERSRFRNESTQTRSRQVVLMVARRRAPSLAAKWLDEMAEEAKRNRGEDSRGLFDDRSARSTVLLQMAKASVADNPQAAAELARESLGDGVSFGFQEVLVAIQGQDFQLAQGVFRTALARLRTVGMSDPNELLILYAYLYTPGKIFSANTSNNPATGQVAVGRDQTRITAAAELNPALALEFLELAADLLVSAPPPSTTATPELTARSQISVINIIIGKVLERLPEKAAALQLKAQQIAQDAKFVGVPDARQTGAPEPHPQESNRDYAERRIDSLEELAEKAPDQLSRDIAYARAALATDADHYQRGRVIAARIDDETLRDNVMNWISYRAALNLIKRRDFAKAYELSARNTDLFQRAATLVVGAQALLEAKDESTAREWLDEARALIKKGHDPDENAPRIALGIISTYARVNELIAQDTLSEAVKLMNQFPNAVYDDDRAPLMKRFAGFGVLANFTYGTRGFSLEAALDALPPDQFENAFYRLNAISSPEARGGAIVVLCRKYLQTLPNPQKRGPRN